MENRIFGVHAVYEALTSGRNPIERIYLSRDVHSARMKDLVELARERGVPVRREDRVALDRLAPGEAHQGVIAITGGFPYGNLEDLFESGKALIVILDGVEDPHNLGAVIRTAEASGASGIIVPERHSAPLSSTVVKASAGATAYLPVVRVKNLVSTIDELKHRGLWIAGVDMSADKDWTDFDYTVPTGLVLGGEHKGLRRLVREHCDVLVGLPMLGKISSLNISVAAGIVLYEAVRQRGRIRSKSGAN